MRRFVGVRTDKGCQVYVDDADNRAAPRTRLPHRPGRHAHSSLQFDWGHAGSEPAELAYALVVAVTGVTDPSPRVYQTLKARLVQQLPRDGWALDEVVVRRHVEAIVREIVEGEADAHA